MKHQSSLNVQFVNDKLDPRFRQFIDLFTEIVKRILDAGVLLVELRNDVPNAFEIIVEMESRITIQILDRIYSAGIKQLHHRLVMDTSPAAKRIECMPFKSQCRCVEERIAVVVGGTVEKPVVEHKYFNVLSATEVRQVFYGNRLRTVLEQVEWRSGRKKTKAIYATSDKSIVFRRSATFTWKEFAVLVRHVNKYLQPFQ